MDMKKILGILLGLIGLIGLIIGAVDYNTATGGGTTIMKSIAGFGGKTASLGVLVIGLVLLVVGLFLIKDMFLGKKKDEAALTEETTEAPAEAPAEEKTEEITEEEKPAKKEEYECPSCGATVPGDATVCPECGEEFEE